MARGTIAKRTARNIEAVDLFCGAGGLSYGMRRAGIRVVAGIDLDPACKYPFEKNNDAKFIQSDVGKIAGRSLRKLFSGRRSIRLLAGCAPCQPFSRYRQGEDTSKDHKWGLLYQFARLVDESSPDIVTMENVPELENHSVFLDFVSDLVSQKYSVSYKIVNCVEYGIPQERRRLVLLASKLGDIHLIPPTHDKSEFVTVRQAIGHMPVISAGEQHPKDSLHRASKLSPLNMRRIKQSRPGGTWKDWDRKLVTACHKKETGQSYPSVYGRMSWDKPAPTMTTLCYGFGNGRFGHPRQHRAISLREAAILQSFPPQYAFTPPGEEPSMKAVGRLIGNAVPVKLGEVIGRSIKLHLEGLRDKRGSRGTRRRRR